MSFTRKLFAGAASVALVAGWAGIASADNVRNDISSTGNDSIVAGGTTTVGYKIQATGAQNACDAADGSSVTISINAPGATATPSSLVFNSCDSFKFVTFTSTSVGDHAITVTATDSLGDYNENPAAFTLHVTAANDLDADDDGIADADDNCVNVANADQADADNDNIGDACDTDADNDGIADTDDNCVNVANADQADADNDNIGDACDTDADNDGIADSDDNCVDVANADQADYDSDGSGDACDPNTSPTVTVSGVSAGANYNKGSVPVATCNVTDAEDESIAPIDPFNASLSPVSGPYASDGIGSQTASCSYTDGGPGSFLTDTDQVTYNIVDPTAPVISKVVTPGSPDGANGWYSSDVTVDWTVSEPESPNSLQTTGCVDQNVTSDQAATEYSCSATSAGGSSGPETVSIKRDATAPAVSIVGGPTNGASYYFGSVPAAPTCSASDATSGLASPCSVSGYSTAVGAHTVTASATDNAGNTNTATASYSVLAWTLNGFYQPVDMGNVVNTVKGGATVPLKFEVFSGSSELTSVGAIKSFTTKTVSCGTLTSSADEIEITTTGGTTLRYDATGGQFIQNWQTPKAAGVCYIVTMTTQDGSALMASFKTK